MKRLLVIFTLMCLGVSKTDAQCNTNVSICTPGTAGPFNFNTPGTPVSSCLDFFGPNTGYIILYITQSGNLNMLIDGSAGTGFLDVAVFNIPSGTSPCNAINSTANEIGCNYASASSGCNQFGTEFPCASSVPAPAVTAGQVLMIVVDNWSGSSNNFTLQLANTAGSAQTGPPNPAINSAGPFCSSSPATQLTAVNNGGTWSGPGTSASGMFNPATAGVGTHTINYSIGSAPCNSSSTTTIQVVSNPSVTINTATICPGGTATLTATPNAAGGTYLWNPGGLTGQTINVSPGSTTTYSCTYSLGGCSSTPVTTTVTVGGAAAITVNSATICPGGSTTLTASGGSGYTWAPATGLSATTGTTVTANPASTTTYTVTNGGCPGSATSTVTVSSNPTVTVNSSTICNGSTATLIATGATTYVWSPATGLSATTGSSVTANPTSTTTYTITGTTASCTGSSTSTVTVNPIPVVTVNSATVCPGGSTTLTAGGATTYSWTPSADLSASTGTSVVSTPTATTVYSVTGTSSGCSSTQTSTVTVDINPTITVNSDSICDGGSIVLTATGASTYSWTPATGLSATTGSTVTANPVSTTVYTITGTTNGCNGTGTGTVTVVSNPTITVNSPTICEGSSITLSASGASSFTWSPATGLSATTGSTVTANPVTTTTYTITGTTATCTGLNTSTVTVDPLPVVTVNSATVCPGASATLIAGGATTYSWSPSGSLDASTGTSVIATPASTTVYSVIGTSNGCSSTQTCTVTVDVLPVVSVNSPAICAGSSAVLNASGASTYSWAPAAGLSSTTGSSVTASPTTTTIYTITGTTNGCNSNVTSTVTVNAIPVVTVNSPSICQGSSVNLTASGGTSFIWTPSAGLSSTSGTTVVANPTVTTTYSIAETSSGCNGSGTCTVTVNPLPAVTASNAGPYCTNQNIQLSCASAAASFIWTGPGGYNDFNQNPIIINANSGHSGTYTVTVVDNNSCQNSSTTLLVVNPLPVVIASNNSPVCENTALILSAGGGVNYSWSGPSGFTSNSQNPTVSLSTTLAMAGNYTVTVTDANNCINANVTTVSVKPLPSAPTVTSYTYCLNDEVQPLSATSFVNGTFNWYGTNPNGTSSTNATIPSTNAAGNTTYYVSQSVMGCEGPKASINVLINPLPVGTLNSIAPKCVPLCDTFIFTSGSVINSYSWNMGISSVNNNSPSISYCYYEAGDYSVTVTITDDNGCTNTVNFPSWVHVNEIPDVQFIYEPNPVTVYEPNATFSCFGCSSNIASQQWVFSLHDTVLAISSVYQPTFTFPDVDTYEVSLTVTSNDGCVNTNTQEVTVQDEFAIYIPTAFSPDNDAINETFNVYGIGIKKVKMMIFDRWGGVIYQTNEVDSGWNGRDSKNNKIEKGVYIYKVEVINYKGERTIKSGHVTVVR